MKSLALLVLVACNGSPTGNQPLPPVTTEAGVPTAATPTRTVGHRNPFGDALQSDNLMVDGDFELTGRSDQAPWIVYNMGQQTLNYDTGGRCHSGIRCAVIAPGDQLLGWAASPANVGFVVRLYLQPDTGRCADATILVVDLATGAQNGSIPPPSSPAADGWCVFEGMIQNMAYLQPVLFVSIAPSAKAKTLHVDEGSVLPVNEVPIHGIKAIVPVDDAALLARTQEAASWVRVHRRYGRSTRSAPP